MNKANMRILKLNKKEIEWIKDSILSILNGYRLDDDWDTFVFDPKIYDLKELPQSDLKFLKSLYNKIKKSEVK